MSADGATPPASCGDVNPASIGTPVDPCDKPPDHDGDHRGYAPVVDEVIFWPRGRCADVWVEPDVEPAMCIRGQLQTVVVGHDVDGPRYAEQVSYEMPTAATVRSLVVKIVKRAGAA